MESRGVAAAGRMPDELRLLQQATAAVAEAVDAAGAVREVVELIVAQTGWPRGTGWLVESDGLVRVDGAPRTESAVVASSLHHGAPAWSGNAVAVPVLAGEDVVAVLEFEVGERTEVAEGLLAVVSMVAPHLGTQVRRRQLSDRVAAVQQELERSNEELRSLNDELRRSNADLADFAYVASHDLSEPLRVISGHVQLLARRYQGQLGDDADRYIAFAVDGCSRMQSLIRDLLEYSRVGQSPLHAKDVDTNRVVAEVLVGVSAAVADRVADIEVGDLPPVVGDPGQLRQLFANLVTNAVKFTRPDEQPRVRITGEVEGPRVRFTVVDHGIGIPERHRERVFRMFQRLHGREEYEGTGIGLAICRRIVDRHGGAIEVEDTPGGGATFVFTLPASRNGTA